MPEVYISDINIPADRFRPVEKIDELAASLSRFGQLQPIVLERKADGSIHLIAGERRLTAAKKLGWVEVDAVFLNEMDELTNREIELEENIQREQMTWQQRVAAIATLDSIRRKKNPNWTQQQTAAMVGKGTDHRDVSEAVKLDQMMKIFPELTKAKSHHQAMNWAKTLTKKVNNALEVQAADISSLPAAQKILLGDSVQVVKTFPDESFHAVITDPPFGIDYDQQKAGTESSLTAYEDSADTYEYLLTMANDLYRIIKPDGWLVWFLGFSWYERCKEVFRLAGFTVDEIPIVWNRSNGRTFTNVPDKWFTKGYDIALHCVKGKPIMAVKGKPNVLTIDPVANEDRELTVERPIELYAEIIRRLTIPGQRILDPFSGSGSCPAAAASIGRDFIGIELDPIRHAAAVKKVSAYYRT